MGWVSSRLLFQPRCERQGANELGCTSIAGHALQAVRLFLAGIDECLLLLVSSRQKRTADVLKRLHSCIRVHRVIARKLQEASSIDDGLAESFHDVQRGVGAPARLFAQVASNEVLASDFFEAPIQFPPVKIAWPRSRVKK